ncbi:MAG: hypothetical protein M0022_06140 [Desulfobacteraceae bacterium]|nr:hypothetical protein [Desulfobacteraceae bacterium]
MCKNNTVQRSEAMDIGSEEKTNIFNAPNYLENFIQSIFDCLQDKRAIVPGGDGRYKQYA